jgi:uncharacterized protein
MLMVIATAKTLDFESPISTGKHSTPSMLAEARRLVDVLVAKSPAELAELMGMSAALGELTAERFADWETPPTPANSRPAILAFAGEVFMAMNPAGSFSERDHTHAQKVLRILSGLYGVLRPLDLIQPYRLEMGLGLETDRGTGMSSFWGERITDALISDLEASPGSNALVNLASEEYFRSVHTDRIDAPVITPRFLVSRAGSEPKISGFDAKRARGAMTGWVIRHRVKSVRGLREFNEGGYRYDPGRSEPHRPVFVRPG